MSLLDHNGPEPDIALVRDDLYAVQHADGVVGYVQKVANDYYALAGSDSTLAAEVGRSLSWDEAVLMVEAAHEASRQSPPKARQ